MDRKGAIRIPPRMYNGMIKSLLTLGNAQRQGTVRAVEDVVVMAASGQWKDVRGYRYNIYLSECQTPLDTAVHHTENVECTSPFVAYIVLVYMMGRKLPFATFTLSVLVFVGTQPTRLLI